MSERESNYDELDYEDKEELPPMLKVKKELKTRNRGNPELGCLPG